ncbi:MAG: MgtC/SapB family protein [Bacilli bacterium]|nr:MgtC/SapB family protein [Bacilli bacterium]
MDPINQLTNGWLGEFSIGTIIIRLVLAFFIGALFGFERSRKRHTAGFRTFTFVALFSTIAALVDIYFAANYGEAFPAITAAVVLGGAIISGNTLLYSSKNQIKGLTTAVALWLTGIVGAALGAGLYTAALIGVVLAFITLSAMPRIEFAMKNKSNHFEIHLELKNRNDLVNFTGVIRKLGLRIDDIEANPAYNNTGLGVYSISLTINSKELKKYKTHTEIIEALSTLEYINCIEEIN